MWLSGRFAIAAVVFDSEFWFGVLDFPRPLRLLLLRRILL
jgi:hypothetical protein